MVKRAVLILPDGAGTVQMPAFDDLPSDVKDSELARSCNLVVRAGKRGIRAHVSGRQLVLEVPSGRVQTIRIAASLSPDELALCAFAHPDWPAGRNRDQRQAAIAQSLAAAAARGEAPLLAPSRTVTIIYATQRPLTSPQFARPLILPRAPNTSTATLADDALEFDRPSTGRIDVYASWEDPVDNPGEDGWRVTRNEMHAGGVRIDDDGGGSKPLDSAELGQSTRSPLSQDFGDTRHHEVTYQAVGTSRFVEFYPASLTEDPDNVTRSSRPVTLHVPSTAPPAPVDVGFSKEHGLPYADIEFLSQQSFMPLVRLALARYQRHAIANCKLSRIVHADFVPLAPGRALTVKQTGRASWSLTMHGHSYRQSDDTTSVVQAHVEYMERTLPEDAVSWRPLGDPVRLMHSRIAAWRFHWSGQIRIADLEFLSSHWRRRLVIQEYECFDPAGQNGTLPDNARLISAHAVAV